MKPFLALTIMVVLSLSVVFAAPANKTSAKKPMPQPKPSATKPASPPAVPIKLDETKSVQNPNAELVITTKVMDSASDDAKKVMNSQLVLGSSFFLWIKVDSVDDKEAPETVFVQIWQVSGNGDVTRVFPTWGMQTLDGKVRNTLEITPGEYYRIPMTVGVLDNKLENYFVVASAKDFDDPRIVFGSAEKWNSIIQSLKNEHMTVGTPEKPLRDINAAFRNILKVVARGKRGFVKSGVYNDANNGKQGNDPKMKTKDSVSSSEWQLNVLKLKTKKETEE